MRFESEPSIDPQRHLLVRGDNGPGLEHLARRGLRADLVYLDPPYNTGKQFVYGDRRSHTSWLEFMWPRLRLLPRAMSPASVLYASIDDSEVARLRMLLDEVFGEEAFIAQVTWESNPRGRQMNTHYALSHEYLLVYARDPLRCALNAGSVDTVNPADFPHEDALGKYRRMPLRKIGRAHV